jgi:hypothetical protein
MSILRFAEASRYLAATADHSLDALFGALSPASELSSAAPGSSCFGCPTSLADRHNQEKSAHRGPASHVGLARPGGAMSKRSILRGLIVASISAVALIAPAGVASASATVTRFTFSETETFADAPPECMPVVKSGVTTATESGSGQVTETDNGSAVHVSGTFVYRTDFSDGSYLTGVAHSHTSIVDSGEHTIFTDVIREPRTIYSADGTAIGTVMIHALVHTTTNNVTGVTTASIEKFSFTCS